MITAHGQSTDAQTLSLWERTALCPVDFPFPARWVFMEFNTKTTSSKGTDCSVSGVWQGGDSDVSGRVTARAVS